MIRQFLEQKPFARFLLVFSICTICLTGVIWACSDSGETEYSVFAPEYFVNEKYSPFFYASDVVYYSVGYAESSNTQFNSIVFVEWDTYFKQSVPSTNLKYLLFISGVNSIDSVDHYVNGLSQSIPKGFTDTARSSLTGKKAKQFFDYLKLARECESYAVNDDWSSWDTVRRHYANADLEPRLLTAFHSAKDRFIKERLWFQLVRYYFFSGDADNSDLVVKIFDQYKNNFPHDLMWYRSLGYVAGHYYAAKDFARANYLYSLCYEFSNNLKIPSFWSFHPQEEADWEQTLKLARTKAEQVTLWQMLGAQQDAGRAIRAIAQIDPSSEKLDLLLSRLINSRESVTQPSDYYGNPDTVLQSDDLDKKVVEELAQKGNTARPYFWNLAAGYLNYLDSNYTAAAEFYAKAKREFPGNDTLVVAQSKVLDILLQVGTLKKIDGSVESRLIAPLNWLADLVAQRSKVENLRFANAVEDCTARLSRLYLEQGDPVKAVCFKSNTGSEVYQNSVRTDALIALLKKTDPTPFEKVMLRYYPYSLNDLYYHQALRLVYLQQPNAALHFLEKRSAKDTPLYGNPFNSRLIDCHDCDHAEPQKQKFTPLKFVQTLANIQAEIGRGKQVYRNAFLAANAFYNITYYGNARLFYEFDIATGSSYGYVDPDSLDHQYYSMSAALKYYKLALKYATGEEQKARCTLMLAKCAQNEIFNLADYDEVRPAILMDIAVDNAALKRYYGYFDELKVKYSQSAYYKDIIKECGYFRMYLKQDKPLERGKKNEMH
ncbi:hypothetical protein MUGA111182_06155 [Mucilaginibacter galii]